MNDAAAALPGALDHAKDVGEAFQDYLDSRATLTGQTVPVDSQSGLPTGTSATAQEALDVAMALEEAADPAAMNELLKDEVKALLDEAGKNGSSAVQNLVEQGKAAVDDAVANAGGELVDFSALARDTMDKINAQKATEQTPSDSDVLAMYKADAAARIRNLAAQYDDTAMYDGAREELEALEASLLEEVQNVTLADGLVSARQELDALVREAETGFARKAAQGQAQKEYLDGAQSLTGTAPDPAASPAREALAAIAAAGDTAAMNDALRDALGTLVEGLVDRENDSDAALALADAVLEDMDGVVEAARDGEIAPLAALTETLRSDLEAQRKSEIAAAQEEYLSAYNALTGENITDLSDPAVKAAADAIGRAQNCAQANAALAKAVGEVLEAMKRPGDAAQVTKVFDDARESVAARVAESGGKIAAVADLLGDVRAEAEALRNAAQTPDDPKPTDPKPTDPKPTDPKPTDPKPTDPKPTDPKPTDPKPTDPKPTNPRPTDPKPTDPEPTEPGPTEPGPTGPAQPDPPGPDGPVEPNPPEPPPTDPVGTAPEGRNSRA